MFVLIICVYVLFNKFEFIVSVQSSNSDWWKNAVIYQIYPRSFMDLDNDGLGDLKGIIYRLDYFEYIGVSAIWLSPIYKSPMVDFGYDVSNYFEIDPIFGIMDDFKLLIAKAQSKNLRVILDFVPNHTSDQHEWFKKSLAADPKYANYYVWAKGRNNNTEPPNNWYSQFNYPCWTYRKERDMWYYHRYSYQQPDLNFRSLDVQKDMLLVMKFWLDLGVSGFRLDAARSLFEDARLHDAEIIPNSGCTKVQDCYWKTLYIHDQPETLKLIYKWRNFMEKYSEEKGGDERIIIAEVYSALPQVMQYYKSISGKQFGAQITFNFIFISHININSTVPEIVSFMNEWFDKLPDGCVSNIVLGSHDNMRLATRYGLERSDGLIMLQMFMHGVAVTYYGEEIGMENGKVEYEQCRDPRGCNNLRKIFHNISRDFERTPFPWTGDKNAGFNLGTPTWLPVDDKYKVCNVALQTTIPRSLLQLYRKLIKLRNTEQWLKGAEDFEALSDFVLKVVRSFKSTRYILLINISNNYQTINLKEATAPNLLYVYITSTNSKRLEGFVGNLGIFISVFLIFMILGTLYYQLKWYI